MTTTTASPNVARFWDRIAPKYAKQPVRDPAAYGAKLARLRSLVQPDDRVLEVGCGTGSTALSLAPYVAEVTATDVSSGMIAIAEDKRQNALIPNIHFVTMDAATELTSAPYDVTMAFSLLHLVDDLPCTLQSLYKQTRPGGLFISKTVCLAEANWAVRLFVRALTRTGWAPRVTVLSGAQVRGAIANAGFQVLEVQHFGANTLNPFIVARRPA